jgi:hypothetical protein
LEFTLNKGWLTKLWICAALAVLVVLVYLFAHHWWGHHFVFRTIDFVVLNLASRSGLSPFLVRGFVILVTIPFFWAVAKYTHGLFWLRGVGPSLRLYRNPYGLIIVGYAGLFFIAMYFASLDAYAYKWCADTPEGIRTFDGAGMDPIYGLQLKPCTFEQIVALRQQQKGFSGPQRIQVDNPHQFEFFNTITGKPRVWFHRSPDGAYELYDRPGKHPGTGEDLRPVDRETVEALVRMQELASAQRAESELQAKTAAQKRERQVFLERYINTAIVRRTGKKLVAVLILPESQDSFASLEAKLIAPLSAQGIEPVSLFFKPQFIQEGRAQRLLAGNWNEAAQLDLKNRVDYVVFGSAGVTYSTSTQFDGLVTANLRVGLKCLEMVAQKVCGSQPLSSTGAGYTKEAALENAATKAKSDLEGFVKTLQLD